MPNIKEEPLPQCMINIDIMEHNLPIPDSLLAARLSRLRKIYRDQAGWCGPASVVTVFDFFGVSATQEEIAKLANYDVKWGTTQEGLIAAIEDKGLYTAAYQNLTLGKLDELLGIENKLAIIDYMDWDSKNPDPNEDGHYAIYVGRDGGKVCLMCSYRGAILIDEKKFIKDWWDIVDRKGTKVKGWALLISPRQLAKEPIAES